MNNHRHPDGSLKIASLKGWAIMYAIVFALLAVKACSSGPDPAELDQQMYCEMVALNRVDPTVGWPDYNDNYDEVCGNAEESAR